MLPFLKPKQIGSVIIAARQKKNGQIESEGAENESSPEFMSAIESLISAVHAKDAKAAAEAFEDAFEALEAQPHEEAEHEQG